MNQDESAPAAGAESGGDAAGERAALEISFTAGELEAVRAAAERAGIAPEDFVHEVAAAVATGRAAPPPVFALIERASISSYVLLSIKRAEMALEGRGREFDDALREARSVMAAQPRAGRGDNRESQE